MANQKISHVRAKLKGSSVNETFDIYDEEALHGIANNLTTTTTGYALDAYQGKILGDRISVESARIDEIASLEPGSTSGDAELIDIRVGADGKTYSDAGTSVRSQMTNMKNDVSQTFQHTIANSTDRILLNTLWELGDVYNGNLTNSTVRARTKDILVYSDTLNLYFDEDISISIVYYSSGAYQSRGSWVNSGNVQIPAGTEFRLVVKYNNEATITITDIPNKLFYYSNMRYIMDALNGNELKTVWELGDVYNGSLTGSAIRARTKDIISYDEDIILYADGLEYTMRLISYDQSGNYSSEGTWTNVLYISSFAKFRLVVKKISGSRINPLEVNNYIELVKSDGLPSYYTNGYIQNKVSDILDKGETSNGQFVFFTDAHILGNSKHSKNLINYIYYHTPINLCVFGGDVATAYGTAASLEEQSRKWIEYTKGFKMPLLVGHGNHDWTIKTSATVDTGVTKDDTFVNYYSSMVNNNLMNISFDHRYVYYDDRFSKIRYILIDDFERIGNSDVYWGVSNEITQSQWDWLVNEALNVESGYSVVTISHAPINQGLLVENTYSNIFLESVLEAYAGKTSISGSDYYGHTVNKDFSSYNGTFVCHISGHNHRDRSATTNGVLSITTACDAHYSDDGISRTIGTTSEQAFDVFSFDIAHRKVYATRIGAGSDRDWTY